ncbi:MAG TPA: response regulator [Alphaproteobacteria bacterium]|nr:response regulator [Alphaproteobacteria bacterium]
MAGNSPTTVNDDGSPQVNGERPLRLMIVEDDAIGALFLERSLIDLGYEVCATADSAPAAVAAADQSRPDFVLMDIRLARGTDGVEAAREIRDRFDIGSMFLTAHNDAATLRRARAVEPLEFLIKPYSVRELASAVAAAAIRAGHRRDA